MTIKQEYGYLEKEYLVFPYLSGQVDWSEGFQTDLVVASDNRTGSQSQLLGDVRRVTGMQSDLVSSTLDVRGWEFRETKLQHLWQSDKTDYLQGDYLTLPYLAEMIEALQSSQTEFINTQLSRTGMQFEGFNSDQGGVGKQVLLRVFDETATGQQTNIIIITTLGMQTRVVLYNTRNLRILYEFDSRGTDDLNWTVSSGGTASGDFGVNNVNTDIVEEVYRSASTQIAIDCDAGGGVSPDTFYIGNHNLTTGATISVQGSDDPNFGDVNVQFEMDATETNAYYIVPTANFPFELSRYWRFNITDSANADGYIQMGAILFGSAVIFQGDCITDRLTRGDRHFKDEIRTEGFTTVSNDRALKRIVGFSLRNISLNNQNYQNFREASEEIRTSLKALWIPMARQPDRFGAFAKLTEMPRETHNVKGDASEDLDFVDWDVNVDESL